jgi:amino acid adenylation domain-containing protein
VSQIPLLTEAERRQILVEWNQTGRDYPRDKCVHQLFEEQVERTPGAVAVMSGECALTYAELNTRANQLAHHLRSLGVGPDVLVGLCVERSPDMVVGQLGVLKAGGAHVPLDAALPPQRLQGMIRQAQIKLLLTHGSLTDRLETGTVQLIRLDQPLAAGPTTTPPSGVGPQHLCYVIFTSGSTGVPKGVRVPHQGVVNLAWWHKGAYGLGVGDRTSQLANLGFDAAAWEIWPTLVAGATLVIAEEDTLKNPEKLVAWLTRRQISVCFMPTPLAMAALQETWPPQSRLRYLLTGGDRLTVRPGGSLGFQLVNHYGPTEATVLATAGVVPPDPTGPPLPSLGRPIANVQVYIVDGHLNLLPPGLAGELCIGGDGLARDYLGEPELTAAKLIPNPFSSIPGARLYKTGDVARWSSDGELEFLGRRDDQVKIRGYRIELGELETALGTLPEVRQAVAIVRADLPGEPQLAAYLTAHGADQPAPATLRARLAEILPDYMIPHLFVWLDRLPLTPNGKVDRKALPAPDGSADTASGPKPPVNLLELELVRLWRRLFQREDIGTQDNFFELGGHSLLAARLAAQIDRWVGCKLPIATLFQTPTIELLARRMADENWVPAWSSLVPLHPQGSRPPLFLIHGWGGDVFCFLELAAMLGPDQPVYGIQAVGLDGKSARHTTVEAMAAHYVREIVSFQPAGPLHLAGFSLGGTIAFEVARQLHARGRRVALLALLDSGPTGAVPRAVFTRVMGAYLVRRCRFHLRQWWHSPWRGQFHFLRGRWRALCFWLRQNRSTPPPVTSPPPLDSQPPQIPGFLDYYRAVAQAYRPGPYPGSAEFFSSGTDKPQWQWYWRHYVRGGVRCHHLSGAHHDMLLSPAHRPELAKALQTVLQHRQAWGR